jgi:hypothetical protein
MENSIGKNEPLHASFSKLSPPEVEAQVDSAACEAPAVVVQVDLVVVDLVVAVDSDLQVWGI